jgi:hypothetical protein
MIFLTIWMMPVYRRSGVRSITIRSLPLLWILSTLLLAACISLNIFWR